MTASARRTIATRFVFAPTASLLAALFLMLAPNAAQALESGARAPEFALPSLDGKGAREQGLDLASLDWAT